MYAATLFYAFTQPQNVIVMTDDANIALAAAKKYAKMNNRSLDYGFPGTLGHGVGVAPIDTIEPSMKKFVRLTIKS